MLRIAMLRALPAALCLAAATPALAAWPAGGMLVSSSFAPGISDAHFYTLPGGDLAVLSVDRCACSASYYAVQRISTEGVIAPGWPAGGMLFSGVLSGISQFGQGFAVDDSARIWHSWANGLTTFLQCFASEGTPIPAPANSSYNLGTTAGATSHVAAATGGDVFVTCGSNKIKRITASGATAVGWPAAGRGLPGLSYDDNALLSDGTGGVVVFMREEAGGGVPVVTRLNGNGGVPAGWDGFGLGLSSEVPSADSPSDSQLLPSGPDHFLAVWSTAAGAGMRRLIMQRFGGDGTNDPAWPEAGLEVVAPDTLTSCRVITDGAGGAYVLRQSHGLPVATHVTGAGTFLSGIDVSILDASAQYVSNVDVFGRPPSELIAEHTPDGGLLVGWNDARLAPTVSFRLRWLTPSLTPAAGKPDSGVVAFATGPHPYMGSLVALRADGPDAALIAWGDFHGSGLGAGDLWMNRVQAPAVLGVTPHPTAAGRLALSAPRPNPARGTVAFDVTLPDDSPARVELLDVAGRVQRTQVVSGAGAHAVTFAGLRTLAPGLYLARVTSQGSARSVRVVVAR